MASITRVEFWKGRGERARSRQNYSFEITENFLSKGKAFSIKEPRLQFQTSNLISVMAQNHYQNGSCTAISFCFDKEIISSLRATEMGILCQWTAISFPTALLERKKWSISDGRPFCSGKFPVYSCTCTSTGCNGNFRLNGKCPN